MKGLGIIIVVLLALILAAFAFGEWAEDRCESAGGHVVTTGRGDMLCVDDDGRIVRER